MPALKFLYFFFSWWGEVGTVGWVGKVFLWGFFLEKLWSYRVRNKASLITIYSNQSLVLARAKGSTSMKSGITSISAKNSSSWWTDIHWITRILHCWGFLLRQVTHIVTLSDSNSEFSCENTQENVAVILKIPQCFDRDLKRHSSYFLQFNSRCRVSSVAKSYPLPAASCRWVPLSVGSWLSAAGT